MKAIKKIKDMTKADATVMAVLIMVALVCAALTVYGIRLILHGNLFAVIWSVFTTVGFCIVSEEAQRLWEAYDNEESIQ